MKLNMVKWKQLLESNPNFDSTIDLTDHFIHITIRFIETNSLATQSISLEDMEKHKLQHTSYVSNKIEDMMYLLQG